MTDRLDHLIQRAAQGRHPGASGNEKGARVIVQALLDHGIGLDGEATAGIAELATLLYAEGFDARDRIRAAIGPNHDDAHFLEPRNEGPGLRYYLEGKLLQRGDLVSVFTEYGWESARYAWNGNEEERPLAIVDEEHAVCIEKDTPCRQPAV